MTSHKKKWKWLLKIYGGQQVARYLMKKGKTSIQNWSEEFDKLEARDDMMLGIGMTYVKLFGEHNTQHLKDFIRTAINQAIAQERERIAKIALECIETPLMTGDGDPQYDEVIEDSIQDAFVRQTIRNEFNNRLHIITNNHE